MWVSMTSTFFGFDVFVLVYVGVHWKSMLFSIPLVTFAKKGSHSNRHHSKEVSIMYKAITCFVLKREIFKSKILH